MTRTFITSCAAAALAVAAAPAFAGNLAEPVVVQAPAPVMAAPVVMGSDWTGAYVGGSLGYADIEEDGVFFDDDANGMTYGVHAGYDYDFGTFVLGGEIEIAGADIEDGTFNTEVDSIARLKARAGYDAGQFMPYLTAGVAQLNLDSGDDTGAVYGVGLDYKMTDNIRVGGEVLKHDFEDFNGGTDDINATTASLRVSYEF
ncbi:outer membrane protein [Thalassorhabdomicrobium marinisediminis]|uniref:outer membrane protein n=1 Tax=Thalassorhabdomicrobium marinisediminis TaxID=2170577 RepID=UPI00249386FE|nr:porin family protein [Thalassorhabdomicrobium marinisediminis]